MSQRSNPDSRPGEGSMLGFSLMSPWRNSPTLESLRSGTLIPPTSVDSFHTSNGNSGPLLASLLTSPGSTSNARPVSSLLPPRHSGPRNSQDTFSWLVKSEDEAEGALEHSVRMKSDAKNILGTRPNSCSTSLLSVQLAALVYQLRELCCELQQDSTTVWFDYRRCLQEEKKYQSDIREARARAENAENTLHQLQNSLAMYEEIEKVRSKDDDRQQKSIEDLRKFLEKERQVRLDAEESQKRVALMWAEKDERQMRKLEALEKEVQRNLQRATCFEEMAQNANKELELERNHRKHDEEQIRMEIGEELQRLKIQLKEEQSLREAADKKLGDATKAFDLKTQAESIRVEADLQKILALQRVAEDERRRREVSEEKLDGLRSQIAKEIKRREQCEEMLQAVTQSFQSQKESEQMKEGIDSELRKERDRFLTEERQMREGAEDALRKAEQQKLESDKYWSAINLKAEREADKLRSEIKRFKTENETLQVEISRETAARNEAQASLEMVLDSMLEYLQPRSDNPVKKLEWYKSSYQDLTNNRSFTGMLSLLKRTQKAFSENEQEAERTKTQEIQKYLIELEFLRSAIANETARREKADDLLQAARQSIVAFTEKELQLMRRLDDQERELRVRSDKSQRSDEGIKSLMKELENERVKYEAAIVELNNIHEKEIETLRDQLCEKGGELRKVEEILQAVQTALKLREMEVQQLQQLREGANADVQEERARTKKTEEMVQSLKLDADDLRRKLDSKQMELVSCQRILAGEQAERERDQQMLQAARQTIELLTNSEKEQKVQMQLVTKELQDQRDNVQLMESRLQRLQRDFSLERERYSSEDRQRQEAAESELASLRGLLEKQKELRIDYEEKLRAALLSLAQYEEVDKDKDETLQNLIKEASERSIQLQAFEQEGEHLKRDLSLAMAKCAAEAERNELLMGLMESMKADMSNQQLQQAEATEQLQALEANLDTAKEREQSSKTTLEEEERKVRFVTDRLSDLIIQNQSKRAMISVRDDSNSLESPFHHFEDAEDCEPGNRLQISRTPSLEVLVRNVEEMVASIKAEAFNIQHELILKSVEERTAADDLRIRVQHQDNLIQTSEVRISSLQVEIQDLKQAIVVLKEDAELQRTEDTKCNHAQLRDLSDQLREERERSQGLAQGLESAKSLIQAHAENEGQMLSKLEGALKDANEQRERADFLDGANEELKQLKSALDHQIEMEISQRRQAEIELDSLRSQLLEEARQREDSDEKLRKAIQSSEQQLEGATTKIEAETMRRIDLEEALQQERMHLNHARQEVEALHVLIAAEISRRESTGHELLEAKKSLVVLSEEKDKHCAEIERLTREGKALFEKSCMLEGNLQVMRTEVERERTQRAMNEASARLQLEEELVVLKRRVAEECQKREAADSLLQASRESIEKIKCDMDTRLQQAAAEAREQSERAAKSDGALHQLRQGIESERIRREEEDKKLRHQAEKEVDFFRVQASEAARRLEQAEEMLKAAQQKLESKEQGLELLHSRSEMLEAKVEQLLRHDQEQSERAARSEGALQQLRLDIEHERKQRANRDEELKLSRDSDVAAVLAELSVEKQNCRQADEALYTAQNALSRQAQQLQESRINAETLSATLHVHDETAARIEQAMQQLKVLVEAEKVLKAEQSRFRLKIETKLEHAETRAKEAMVQHQEAEERLQQTKEWLDCKESACNVLQLKSETLEATVQHLTRQSEEQQVLTTQYELELQQLRLELERERALSVDKAEQLKMSGHEFDQQRIRLESLLNDLHQKEEQAAGAERALLQLTESFEREEELTAEATSLRLKLEADCQNAQAMLAQEITQREKAEVKIECLLLETQEKGERIARYDVELEALRLDLDRVRVELGEREVEMYSRIEKENAVVTTQLSEEKIRREQAEEALHAAQQVLSTQTEELERQMSALESLSKDFHQQAEKAARAESALQQMADELEAEQALKVKELNLRLSAEREVELARTSAMEADQRLQEALASLTSEQNNAEIQKFTQKCLELEVQKQSERAARFKESLQQLRLDVQMERTTFAQQVKQMKLQHEKESNELKSYKTAELVKADSLLHQVGAEIDLLSEKAMLCEETITSLRRNWEGFIARRAAQDKEIALSAGHVQVLLKKLEDAEGRRADAEHALAEKNAHESLALAEQDSCSMQIKNTLDTTLTISEGLQQILNSMKTNVEITLFEAEQQRRRADLAYQAIFNLRVEFEGQRLLLSQKQSTWLQAEMEIAELCDRIEITARRKLDEQDHRSQSERERLSLARDRLESAGRRNGNDCHGNELQSVSRAQEASKEGARERIASQVDRASHIQDDAYTCTASDSNKSLIDELTTARLEIESERELRRSRDVLYSNMQEELCNLKQLLKESEILKETLQAQLAKQKSEFEEQLENVIHACVAEELVSEESRKREAEALAKLSVSYSRSFNSPCATLVHSTSNIYLEPLSTDDKRRYLSSSEHDEMTQGWISEPAILGDVIV